MVSGNVVFHALEYLSRMISDKKEGYVLFLKVVSKPSLLRNFALKPER